MAVIKKSTSLEKIDSLIDFYNQYRTEDKQMKKLIVMNLKQLKKRMENEINARV